MTYCGPSRASVRQPIPAFWVRPKMWPLGSSRSMSGVSGRRPAGPSPSMRERSSGAAEPSTSSSGGGDWRDIVRLTLSPRSTARVRLDGIWSHTRWQEVARTRKCKLDALETRCRTVCPERTVGSVLAHLVDRWRSCDAWIESVRGVTYSPTPRTQGIVVMAKALVLASRIRVPMAGPCCDAVVGRWPLGSRRLPRSALNLADPHWLLARSGDRCRPDLHTDSPRQHKCLPE